MHEGDDNTGADAPDDLVPCLEAPIGDANEILAACEEADIAAALSRGMCCGRSGCGCAPKLQLMVARADVPRVAALLQSRWNALLDREALDEDEGEQDGEQDGQKNREALAAVEGEHQPCPACGTAAPLVEGACSDCGLQLE